MICARRSAGFTLVEMLVAITLMALMGVVCWRGLAFVAAQRAGIEEETLELTRMMRAFAQIERDIAERLPDVAAPARSTAPELPLALVVLPVAEGAELEVLRALQEPSGASRIVPGGAVLLLPGVARLRIRVHAGGFWLEPGERGQPVRPFARASALEIALEDAKGGRYVKVVEL